MDKYKKNFNKPWTPPGIFTHPWQKHVLIAGTILYGVIGVNSIDVRWERIVLGMERAERFFAGFLRPDFISKGAVIAVSATGAHPLQVLCIGILPQVMPAFVGISLYRWDINIRESTVLGLVGAGGIGLQLQASINILAWRQVSMILLLLLTTVLLSE